jgi:serine/threonine protein kinase/Rieske Fe-S protein
MWGIMKTQSLSVEHLVGKTFHGYSVSRLLGSGKLNAVYAVQQEVSLRPALLTVFLVPDSLSPEALVRFRQRFTQVAEKLSHLDHPHVLPISACGEEYDYPYLITPSLPDNSLAQLLSQGPLTPELTLEFFQQIAAALDYAHLNGVIHGSLKPANILFDNERNVQIAHLGLVDMLALRGIEISERPYSYLLSVAGTFLGIPEYMAPEVVRGNEPDARSDVYALGMLIYELLSGALPFTGDDPLTVALQHVDQPLPPLTTLSPLFSGALDLVIQHALDPDPVRRYQTPGKFVAAFERALGVVEKVGPPQSEQQPSAAQSSLQNEDASSAIAPSDTAGHRQGLLAKTTDKQQIPDLPTFSPLPFADISPGESGGWQLRPPIITDKMAAIRSSTGSQTVISSYAPVPVSAQMQEPVAWSPSVTMPPDAANALPGSIGVEGQATMAFPSVPPSANQELTSLPRSGSVENQATLIFPPLTPVDQNNRPLDAWNSASASPDMFDRSNESLRNPALSDNLVNPYAFFSPNTAMGAVPPIPLGAPGAYPSVPSDVPAPARVRKGRRKASANSPVLSNMPASARVDKGRRNTVAVVAGSVAAVGLLGLGGFSLAHFLQNKSGSPSLAAAKPTEAAAKPAKTAKPAATTPAKQKPPAKATAPANMVKTPPMQKNVIGQKSQPINSSTDFTNPADKQASLLIHLPNGNFVAYESACTHQQVPVAYDPQQHLLICPLHHSVFDPAAGAKVLNGPAVTPLALVKITINADGSVSAL